MDKDLIDGARRLFADELFETVRQVGTLLKDIDCPNCGKGYVIKTGQDLDA